VGAISTDYIPKNDEVKVNAGFDPEVQLKSKRKSFKKVNLTFGWSGNQQYIRGWDTIEEFELTVKNFRNRDVEFEVNVNLNGDFEFVSATPSVKIDYQTQRFTLPMKAGESKTINYTVTTHQGSNVRNK
jgi:hypothetical protein